MSKKQVHRPGLLKALAAGRLTNQQAARALQVSVRQVQRLKRRYRAGGAGALQHGNRGRPSPHRLPATVRSRVQQLMTTVYQGFNDTHLTEKLREVERIAIGRESVRRLRRELGVPAQRTRRAPTARRRRTPEAARGSLVQIDGSPFAWLEDRGPTCTLLGAVDDATTEILALQFRPTEDLHGYMTLFRELFTVHGLPLAIYGDRLSVLVRNDPHWSLEEQLAGRQAPTHVGHLLAEVGVGYIAAHSPQAKGRIERLWATLQDRLVSELRWRRITTVAAAQAYLPEFIAAFNRRFGKPPRDPVAVWRRPPRDLSLRLACCYPRLVARDNTVPLGPRWVQLRSRRSYAGVRVEVRELLDGRLVVLHHGTVCGTAPAPPGDFVLKPRRSPRTARVRTRRARPRPGRLPQRLPRLAANTHTGRRPLPTHPWVRATDRDIRQRERRLGVTFSRGSEG